MSGIDTFLKNLQNNTVYDNTSNIPTNIKSKVKSSRDIASGSGSFNSIHQNTITIVDNYSKRFPNGYYYYGYIVNKSNSDIVVSVLKQDGYTIENLVMEANTRLVMKGINIQELVVASPASFRFDFIGSDIQPLPGNETIDIITYVIQTSNIIPLKVETLPFTVPQNGTLYLQLVGTGAASSVSFDNGNTYYTLNGGTTLVTGSLYEFEIHVAENDKIQVENATVRKVFYEA